MQYVLDVNKMVRGILLAILTFFIIHLVKSGDINLLVSPVITNIVNFSVIPFIVLTLATLKYSLIKRSDEHHHHHDHHPHKHTVDCECGHNHANPSSFWAQTTLGLLFVSLALAYSWHPKPFGTDMIAQAKTQNSPQQTNKSANVKNTNTTSSDHSAYAPGIINVSEDTVGIVKQTSGESEASIAMRYGANPNSYWGKKVDLDGFVYHPNGLPANHFILTRFFIFCCVADANPIGITVNSKEASQLKNDTWVHISGVIQSETLPILDQIQPTNWFPNDTKKPVILSESIRIIPTPEKPYMIPN